MRNSWRSGARSEPAREPIRPTTLARSEVRAPGEAPEDPLGRPFQRRTPFFIGLTGALGVAVAYIAFRALADIGGVLLIIGVSLFLAIGLDPAVAWLCSRGLRRTPAVLVIVLAFLVLIGGFVAAAIPPITHEVTTLTAAIPRYRRDVAQGRGWVGHLAHELHLSGYLEGADEARLKNALAGGALGAGKALISATTGTLTTIVLTIYFLVALPRVKHISLSLVPASRREHTRALTDETFARVGGFVLGNLLTSAVAGIGTFVWLSIFGIPYPFLLALFVALFDLLPVVGSTIAGVVVSLVALSKGIPVALATAAFYTGYRLFEDYLLTPRVMHQTVRISPGLTIVATLIGGSLLGLIGALVAIPCAATIYLLLEEIVFPRMDRV